MTADYHSFLICFHPGHTDVFRNGMPLGVIRDGVFHVHYHLMPDKTTKVPVVIPADLKAAVHRVIEAMPDERERQQ